MKVSIGEGLPRGGPARGSASSPHPGRIDCQPRSIIVSAAAFGSGNSASRLARSAAACAVSGLRRRWRWSSTAAACRASSTASSSARGVGDDPVGVEGVILEGVISLGGVGGISLGETVSTASRAVTVCPRDRSDANVVLSCFSLERLSRFRMRSASRRAATFSASARASAFTTAAICSAVQPAASIASMTFGSIILTWYRRLCVDLF